MTQQTQMEAGSTYTGREAVPRHLEDICNNLGTFSDPSLTGLNGTWEGGNLAMMARIAVGAGRIVMGHYRKPIVEIKKDGTPVTQADKASNDYIVGELMKYDPGFPIITEEAGVLGGDDKWGAYHIDPIDGTKSFINATGNFAVHIGYAVEGKAMTGVVYNPSTQELYFGVAHGENKGAWRADPWRGITQIKTTDNTPREYTAITSANWGNEERAKGLIARSGVKKVLRSGSFGLRLMKVAEGIANISFSDGEHGAHSWDIVAPHAILLGAGGTLDYLSGGDGSGNTVTYGPDINKEYHVIAARNQEDYDRAAKAVHQ